MSSHGQGPFQAVSYTNVKETVETTVAHSDKSSGHIQSHRIQRRNHMRERAAYFREYRIRRAAIRDEGGLLPFQAAFATAISRKENPVDIAALSVPRGNGKSWLCGAMVARSLTPGDLLFEPAVENVLVAASRAQAGIVLEFARAALGESGAYLFRVDGAIHIETFDAGAGNQFRQSPGAGTRRERANCDCG